MQVLYFAWVRTKINKSSDTICLDSVKSDIKTVSDLVEHLKTLGDGYADAFSNIKGIRVAINQEFAEFNASVSADDEVAFFPPVTGG